MLMNILHLMKIPEVAFLQHSSQLVENFVSGLDLSLLRLYVQDNRRDNQERERD